jgi:hypothetical protein
MPNTYLTAGDYTINGPGGADVGSFSGGLRIAQDFLVSDNPDNFKVVNRSNPLTVNWTGGESGTIVTLIGSSGTIDLQTNTVSGTAFVCRENVSAGHFTVPSSVLSQLPASPVISAGGFSIVTRGGFSVSDNGNGVRFTSVPGLDLLTAINLWTWSFTPQYQ